MDPRVQQVRRFNRAVGQRIGGLDDSFLGRGRPMGESRLLFEIGMDGAELRALRARLGLDSGYVSRMLRSLERQGLVDPTTSAADARVRRIALTPAGRAEVAELTRRSDALAESMLAPLAETQRERLVQAMDEVERLLRASAVEIGPARPSSAAARACLSAYFEELDTRFEAGFDPGASIPADDRSLTSPSGILLIATLHEEPVGCGALKALGGGVADIKRMWVAEAVRGLGVGRRILAALEEQARAWGVGTLRLETNAALGEAQSLYRSSGYSEVAPFSDERYAHHWFEKRL